MENVYTKVDNVPVEEIRIADCGEIIKIEESERD